MDADWDEFNIEHIARHNVCPNEAEEALLDRNRVSIESNTRNGERRWVILGKTYGGRLLVVVFTRRGEQIRVVTARNATSSEKRRYKR
jgi:uncharacterized DUF497 family protein